MVRVAFFDVHHFEKDTLEKVGREYGFELCFKDLRLNSETAHLVKDERVVSCFVNDQLNEDTLEVLHQKGVELIALRCAGFNHVDIESAQRMGIKVVRVPNYSPHAVAEHAVALLLSLNRKIHRAHQRVREMNFSLEGLVGFDLYQKNVGIIGLGKIGKAFAQMMNGFGCRVLAYDPEPDQYFAKGLGYDPDDFYVDLEDLYSRSKIVSLHLPLNSRTRHIINQRAIDQMKPSVLC
jgi:D-lactate dehydrogenase